MHAETQDGTSLRFSPRLTQVLAVGWVATVAFLFLFRCDGWLVALQFANLLGATLPTLAVGPHCAVFCLSRLVDTGCVVAILATAFAVGAVVIDRLTPKRDLLGALFSVAVGLWVLSVAILVLGIVSVSLLPWVFLLAGCWLLPAPRGFFRRIARGSDRLDGWAKFMLACIIVAALLNLLGAMAPPFEYDELEYHLGAPAEYVKAGRIVALPHNFYSNLPQLTEMLYLLALKMSSGVGAKLLQWSFGVLSAVAIYAMAAQVRMPGIGVTAAALFYCLPFVHDLSRTARIDLATAFFAVLTFGALLMWSKEGGERKTEHQLWLWLSALATGAAVATKWTAVAVVLLPAAMFVAVMTRSLRRLAVFCLLSSLFVIPWLVKNWLFMGNPVYPLLNGLFHSPHWTPEQSALFAEKHYASFGWDGWLQFGGLIWQYSFREPLAVPLLLMTAPLILLLKQPTSSARRAGWLFVAAYVGWFLLTFRPWRFLFPAFPLAAIVAAVALDVVWKWARIAIGAVILTGLSGMGLGTLIDVEKPERVPPRVSFISYAFGQVSRDEFIESMGRRAFEPVLWMNQHLPADATVLYVGEARAYYARHRVLWSTAFDQHPLDTLARPPVTSEGLWRELRAQGVTHVYVNFSEWERLRVNYGYLLDIDTAAFRQMLESHAQRVHASDRLMVWELNKS